MSKSLTMNLESDQKEIESFFEERAPVLVEVRFRHTSSDYHIVSDYEDFVKLMDTVTAQDTPFILFSVLDVESSDRYLRVLK